MAPGRNGINSFRWGGAAARGRAYSLHDSLPYCRKNEQWGHVPPTLRFIVALQTVLWVGGECAVAGERSRESWERVLTEGVDGFPIYSSMSFDIRPHSLIHSLPTPCSVPLHPLCTPLPMCVAAQAMNAVHCFAAWRPAAAARWRRQRRADLFPAQRCRRRAPEKNLWPARAPWRRRARPTPFRAKRR